MKSIYLSGFEKGYSYLATTKVSNVYVQASSNLPRIGITAVYNNIQQINHQVSSTTVIPQTNKKISTLSSQVQLVLSAICKM